MLLWRGFGMEIPFQVSWQLMQTKSSENSPDLPGMDTFLINGILGLPKLIYFKRN